MNNRILRIMTGSILVFSALMMTTVTEAQQGWNWPDRSQNLQVLPKDFPPERLQAVMTGFTRSLGVRCDHCHVGQDGQPLSTFDFASDEDPQKNTARAMLNMLGAVNDHLDGIEPTGPKRVNMWCHTCHRGQARPHTLQEDLTEVYEGQGIDAVVSRYRELREKFYGAGGYDFSESHLNRMGYFLLGLNKGDDAIKLFRLNREFHPGSANVYDSLAEVYAKQGRHDLAIIYYQRSLEINPDNKNAIDKLKELKP